MTGKRNHHRKYQQSAGTLVLRKVSPPAGANLKRKESMRLSTFDQSREANHAKIFASMCPDEILDYYENYDMRSYDTTLMLGDISGFTDMTEKFTKSGKGGPSKLTETLNSYIGAMVQEILSHGGDVLKFSGDAFIVMWKLDTGRLMRDIATEAIKTACIIQKHFGTYETEIDVSLKVKLAIASGKTYFTSIGDPNLSSYYIIIGKPVWEVKFAEGLCRGGDILVAPSCWQYVNPNEYIYELLPDGVHTLISSLSVLWHTKSAYSADNIVVLTDTFDSDASTVFSNLSSDGSTTSSTSQIYADIYDSAGNTTDYTLRAKLIKAARNKMNNELRSYMPRPVIRSVELDEPLEYLTEIRHVVIVFVNVITKDISRKTLVKLVKATYLFVCRVVSEMQGCVNKTSLFDKDLIFLCIFGLRGDKHELESQIGLRCASQLRRGLANYQHVDSVTVGVTSGMTYCGVVGHVLRREYTVIGMAVNKAARLMCAYSNKVVCDRESFLQSHLEARHFILQEPKHLKGISNVGPIYEFLEQSSIIDHEINISKYPLLGRDEELHFFQEALEKLIEGEYQEKRGENDAINNVIILKGDPRIGKTRLLEEVAHIASNHVRVNFVSLAPYDNQMSFVLLRLIFFGLLDLNETSNREELKSKLSDLLKNAEEPLCVLNRLFNVNFEITPVYTALNPHSRRRRLRKLLRRLSRICAASPWIVIIDDAELADDDSLGLFTDLARYCNAVFIFSYGNKLSKDYVIPESITRMSQIVELHGLDKWYHSGLACQVMDVIAIPVELEKVIQERSSGNPGWIESYLLSLMQSRGVVIEKLTDRQIHELGLAVPSFKMLKRPSGTPEFKVRSSVYKEKIMWKMYRTTFKESYTFFQREDERRDSSVKHNVCLLSSEFTLGEVDAETTMDTILVKLYDSLTPLDQYFIKCAAVLGEVVDRKMLENLLKGTPERDIGVCVVKLFELRIIGCAVGDFSRSPGPAMLFRKVLHPSLNIEVRCGCKGVVIPHGFEDLPSYASCSLMRFKLDMFRETTYSLLTENQKVEFHSKALRYLQQNARRCNSCGGGQFNTLLGESSTSDVVKGPTVYDPVVAELTKSSMDFTEDVTRPPAYSRCEKTTKSNERLACFSVCKPIIKSPTRTFANVNLVNCECNLILLTTYTHVLEHCRGIGIKKLLLVAILEFVEVCISTLNIPQATKLLREAEGLIEQIFTVPEDALIVIPYLKGKVQTLRGQCFLESGLLTEAMTCFETTLRIMGYSFPSNRMAISIKTFWLLRKQYLMLTYLRTFRIGVLSGDEANYSDQFAACLAQMFILFRNKGMQDHARLAAIWGLNTALASNKDFLVLCTSYAHMIITGHFHQYNTILPLLETDAINLCFGREEPVEMRELGAIAELYACIFRSRWIRGLRKGASSIGHVAAKLTAAAASLDLELIVLPKLTQLVMSQKSFDESIDMLKELEAVSKTNEDLSGTTWYYALCINLLLESGISLVLLKECEQFYQQESSKIIDVKDFEAAKRFFISMWLWYIRIGDWESAFVWKDRQCGDSIIKEYTVTGAITELQKLEGLIINYVARIEYKNYKDAEYLLLETKAMMKEIEHIRKIVKIIEPRYLIMKAYYNMARLHTNKGMSLIRKAKKVSLNRGNVLIYEWAEHNEKAWLGSMNLDEQNSWKDACLADQLAGVTGTDTAKRRILPYTLPVPSMFH